MWSVPERRLLKTFRLSIPELTGGRQNAGMIKYGTAPRFFIAGLK